MTYRCKNRGKLNGVCSNYQWHEKPWEKKLEEKSKFNFQTRNKIRLCDSKTRAQKLKTKTQDVQNKCENGSLLCYHMQTWTWKEHE
jgi:hypothetical protein